MPVGSMLSATGLENTQAPEGYFKTLMEIISGQVRGKTARFHCQTKGGKKRRDGTERERGSQEWARNEKQLLSARRRENP